jgi:hypothetical protein
MKNYLAIGLAVLGLAASAPQPATAGVHFGFFVGPAPAYYYPEYYPGYYYGYHHYCGPRYYGGYYHSWRHYHHHYEDDDD